MNVNLRDLFRAEVVLHLATNDSDFSKELRLEASDISQYFVWPDTCKDLDKHKENGYGITRVYARINDGSYDQHIVLESVDEVKELIDKALEERLKKVQQLRLGVF